MADERRKKTKVEFTPEQQEKVGELMDKAFGKGFKRGQEAAADKIQRLIAEVAALRAKKSKLAFWR